MFITQSKDIEGFYSVDANVNYENIIGNDATKKARTSLVPKGKTERFVTATIETMKSFEHIRDYDNLVAKENSPKLFFKKLFSKS